jgi:DNA replication protein DnaC
MLNNQTIEGLNALRLAAMAAGLAEQRERADYQALSFEERLGLLVDRELAERDTRRLSRYLKQAKLRTNAVVEDVDFRRRRGLDRAQFLGLAEAGFVKNHHDIVIVGPTGLGKTYLACALANSAIRRGHNALYLRGPRMLEELSIARVDGRFGRLMASWSRVDVLVIDDFLLRPLDSDQAADMLEVIEDRTAPLDDLHKPAANRPVAPGPRRPDGRRRVLGPGAREAAPHRARGRVDAPARGSRRSDDPQGS